MFSLDFENGALRLYSHGGIPLSERSTNVTKGVISRTEQFIRLRDFQGRTKAMILPPESMPWHFEAPIASSLINRKAR